MSAAIFTSLTADTGQDLPPTALFASPSRALDFAATLAAPAGAGLHTGEIVPGAAGGAAVRIENLGDEQFAAELELEDVVLVDLREQSERQQSGAIPDAVHIPRGLLEFCADPTLPAHRAELDPDKRIVLYCAVGGRSALAAGGAPRHCGEGKRMSAAANKRLLERVFADFSEGNAQTFLDAWPRTCAGRSAAPPRGRAPTTARRPS
jgi:rhodanese-related sulfurtransferase